MSKQSETTLVTFLLDRSSSMGSCLDSTIEAFNGYVEELKRAATPILFTSRGGEGLRVQVGLDEGVKSLRRRLRHILGHPIDPRVQLVEVLLHPIDSLAEPG